MSDTIVARILDMCDRRRCLRTEERLFRQGEPVRSLFVVRDGLIELTRYQHHGASIVLQRAGTGEMLAEASMYSSRYHCDAVTTSAATVDGLAKSTVLQMLRDHPEVANLWAQHLARETQAARYRAELLSLKTVCERLDGWLAWHDGQLPPRGEWKRLALQIGVSPEALYREMSKRRQCS